MKDLPEGLKKRIAENNLYATATEFKGNTKEIAKKAYQNNKLDDETLLERVSADDIRDLNSTAINGWVLVELLMKQIDKKDIELGEKQQELNKHLT